MGCGMYRPLATSTDRALAGGARGALAGGVGSMPAVGAGRAGRTRRRILPHRRLSRAGTGGARLCGGSLGFECLSPRLGGGCAGFERLKVKVARGGCGSSVNARIRAVAYAVSGTGSPLARRTTGCAATLLAKRLEEAQPRLRELSHELRAGWVVLVHDRIVLRGGRTHELRHEKPRTLCEKHTILAGGT